MKRQERAAAVLELLKAEYPSVKCTLNYQTPIEMLIATQLSAQCTDKRVNMVTPALFAEFPNAKSMGEAPLSRVEELIRTCGLYKTKAKDLVAIGKEITERFGGKVPDTIEELTTLPGIGRKTANLVCGDIYGKPAVVTDTHFIRLCNRLGLVETTNPLSVEKQMRKLLPPEKSNDFCHRTVLFGRDVCTARKAHCEACVLSDICPKKI